MLRDSIPSLRPTSGEFKMSFKRDLQFYKIEPNEIDFTKLVSTIFSLPRTVGAGGQILTYSDFSIALTEFKDSTRFSDGLIVRLRTDDIPVKGSLSKNVFTAITLAADEGLAEMTYFIFDKNLRVLCLLPAKNGVKWGTFTSYIKEKSNTTEFDLLPLLSEDAMAIFNSFNSITSIETDIRIGNGSSPNSKAVQEMPLNMALDKDSIAGAVKINVGIYAPKSEGGLKIKAAKVIARAYKMLSGVGEAESLVVKGSKGPEFTDQLVDLISQRYLIQIQLRRNRGRNLDFAECRKEVQKKILENEEIISKLTQ